MNGICSSDKLANPKRFGFVEIEFCNIEVSKYTELTAPILFEDLRAVRDLRHSSPDFPHGGEDPRFLSGRHMPWRGDRAQLRDRLASAFDHDNAAL
jgi:hypothetical protein